MTILRPFGLLIAGQVELGLELVFYQGKLQEIRPQTGMPDPWFISPAFVNAHSHFEYRGMQDRFDEPEYWSWIWALTQAKVDQTPEEVRADCLLAAQENRATGVWRVEEHSDRIGSAEAMSSTGLKGHIYQELITFLEFKDPESKLNQAENRAREESKYGIDISVNPHASYTVGTQTLTQFAGKKISLHVAETEAENEFFQDGSGRVGDFYRRNDNPYSPTGKTAIASMLDLGLGSPQAQFVHCCAAAQNDVELMAKAGVRVAHCPRSNIRLDCPHAPIREMLDAGIEVGLGLDSPASGGPIDMFAEMRAAQQVSLERGKPLTAKEIWQMATGGAAIGDGPLIKIECELVQTTQDLMDIAIPKNVFWPNVDI